MYYFIDFNPGIFRNQSCLPGPIQSGGHGIAKIPGSDDKKQYNIIWDVCVCILQFSYL